jgi:hypothetical protein
VEEGGRNWPRLLRFNRTISICVRFMLTLCVRIPLLHICNLAEANFKTTRRPLGLELAHVPMRARYTATCFVSLEQKHASDPTSSLRCRHTLSKSRSERTVTPLAPLPKSKYPNKR